MPSLSRSVIVVAAMLTCACAKEAAPDRPLFIDSTDAAVARLLHEELTRQAIPHEYDGNTLIKYVSTEYARVSSAHRRVLAADLPAGRSVSFTDPLTLEAVVLEFDRAHVIYEKKTRHGDMWVVWAPESAVSANRIVEQAEADRRRRFEEANR